MMRNYKQKSKNKKFNLAFTLTEVIIAITLIGFLSAITLVSSMNSINIKNQKAYLTSYATYESIYGMYVKMTKGADPYKLENDDGTELFTRLGGALKVTSLNEDCSNVVINGLELDKCVKTSNGIKLGAKIDSNCETTVRYYTYLKKEDMDEPLDKRRTKTIENACGYIIYTLKKSQKMFKQDAFIIPLMKHSVG